MKVKQNEAILWTDWNSRKYSFIRTLWFCGLFGRHHCIDSFATHQHKSLYSRNFLSIVFLLYTPRSTNGSGHRTFYATIWVRIPCGVLKIKFVKLNCRLTIRHYFYTAFLLLSMAGKNKVAVWVSSLVGKAPHLHCGDHGFDSHLCPLCHRI